MPRSLHRLYANLRGYFWTDCPVCGAWFGGHEWKLDGPLVATIPTGVPNTGTAICPSCTVIGYGYH